MLEDSIEDVRAGRPFPACPWHERTGDVLVPQPHAGPDRHPARSAR
ncbi:hypothetical protein [Nonomuraea rosea]